MKWTYNGRKMQKTHSFIQEVILWILWQYEEETVEESFVSWDMNLQFGRNYPVFLRNL